MGRDDNAMMKKLLPILALLLVSPLLHAQAFVHAANCTGASTTTCAVTITVTVNDLIVACSTERFDNTSTLTVTDSASQTGYTQTASSYVSNGTTSRSACFVRPNSAALTSVTCTWNNGTGTTINCIVFEFSGMATASAEDSSVNNTQSAVTTATSGAITTTNANDACTFLTTLSGAYTSPAAGTSYTLPVGGDTASRSFMTERIVSATQSGITTTSSWTTSLNDASIFACFKAADGAAAPSGFNKRQKIEQLEGIR